MEQFDGLVRGYSARVEAEAKSSSFPLRKQQKLVPLDMYSFLLLNAIGDADTLLDILDNDSTLSASNGDLRGVDGSNMDVDIAPRPRLSPIWDKLSPAGAKSRIAKRGHCSALIKVTSDLSVSVAKD